MHNNIIEKKVYNMMNNSIFNNDKIEKNISKLNLSLIKILKISQG